MRKCWPAIGCPVIDLPGSGAHSGWHCPRSGQWAKNKVFREYQKKLGFWRRAILEKAARRHYRYLKPSFERVHCPIIWSIYELYSITYHKAWRGVYTPLSHDGASALARPSPINASYWYLTRLVAGSWLPLLVARGGGGVFRTRLEISGSYQSIFKIQTEYVSPQHDLHFWKKEISQIRRRGY